jgi:hypothetical protein
MRCVCDAAMVAGEGLAHDEGMAMSRSTDQPIGDAGTTAPAGSAGLWWGSVAMVLAGAFAIGLAVLMVTVDGPPEFRLETATDWMRELGFLGYLAATVVSVAAVRRRGVIPKIPSVLIQVGYGLLVIGVTAGLVLREDPDWFFVLGGPGNLMAGVGFVWWAIWAATTRTLPVWLAVLGGVGGFVAVLGSEFGTGVLIGSFWLALAAREVRTADAAGS